MTFIIGWPQIIWIALILIGIVGEIVKHGEAKQGTHDAISYTVFALLSALLMYWGGFFG